VEKSLANPLKASKKLALKGSQCRSSGLSVAEKVASIKSGTKKQPLTFVKGDKVCYVSTRVSTFMGSSSSESRGASPALHRPVATATPPPMIDLTSSAITSTPIAGGEASAGCWFCNFPLKICDTRFCEAGKTHRPVTCPLTNRLVAIPKALFVLANPDPEGGLFGWKILVRLKNGSAHKI
jgi:hypothetical protein